MAAALTSLARHHWSLLAVAAVYLGTLCLAPREGMWIVDNENRLLQAEALANADFREYAIPWPGQELDPGFTMNPLRFNPEGTFAAFKDGRLISVFQPAFIVLSALAWKALGAWGLYLLPLGGALLMLAGVRRLALALGQGAQSAHIAVLIAGLATPAWFYSQVFWEHTTAAALCVWAVVHAVRFLGDRSRRSIAVCCALLAASLFFRDVLVLFAACLLGLLLLRCRDARPRIVATSAAVLGLGVALLLVFQGVTTGRPLGFHAGTLLESGEGPAGHLRSRPLLLYIYFVASHPEQAWSFLLASPFLAAFVLRPRLTASRAAAAVPLWALAAAAAGTAFLAGFLTSPSAPRHMLMANGFFGAAPIVILGLLRARDERPDPRRAAADLVLAAAALHFVAYCLVAPWAGAVSLHWGGRLLFDLYPLLAVLAAGTLDRWNAAAGRRRSWRTAAIGLLLLVSCAGQVYSIAVLAQKKAYSERLARAVAGFPQKAVVTNVWWVGHEMHATFFARPIFYIRSQEQFDALAARLRARGIDSVLFASRPQPGRADGATVRVRDGTWDFYSLDLFAAPLR